MNRIDSVIKKLISCCDWSDEHNGKKPSPTSKNVVERKYGCFLDSVRSSCKRNTSYKRYYVDVLKERGYLYWLEKRNYEKEAFEKLMSCCDWADKHNGKKPNVNFLRGIKSGKNKTYTSFVEILNKRGYSNWIKKQNNEMVEKIIACCDWADEHGGKKPRVDSIDKYEKKIAMHIRHIQCKKPNDYVNILKKRGYSHWLMTRKQNLIKQLITCCDWADKHNGCKPPENKFKNILKLLSRIRNKSKNNNYFIEYEEILIKRGYLSWVANENKNPIGEKTLIKIGFNRYSARRTVNR